MKEKIVFDLSFVGDSRVSGVERFSLELYKRLKNCNEREFIAILPKGFINSNINITNKYCLSKSKIINHLVFLPIFIYLNKPTTAFFPSFPPTAILSLMKKCNFVRAIHDSVYWDKPETLSKKAKWYLKPLEEFWIKKYARTVTVSNHSKDRLRALFKQNPEKIQIVPNGVSASLHDDNSPNSIDTNRYILSVGTIEPRKNFEFLVDVFELLADQDKDISLVICGRKGWSYNKLARRVAVSSYSNRISIVSDASDSTLGRLYEKCELFIFPSLDEGFGIPLIEAMSKGKIVVAADNSAITEIVKGTGLLVQGYDASKWADVTLSVLNGTVNTQELKDAAICTARKYSWEESTSKLIKALSFEK